MEADAAKRTPQQPLKPKATPTTVSSGHQPNDGDSAVGLVATVRQGRVKHSTHDERDYTPPASPQKGSPRKHDPDIKLSGVGNNPIG
jgi:hypothetical protein